MSKGAGPTARTLDADAWTAQPTAIRIYPTTRFVGENGVLLLEARIEVFDQMGDSFKTSGAVRLEISAAGETPGVTTGQLLYRWDLVLNDLEAQQKFYDPVTRTYLFRLKIDNADVTQRRTRLGVTWQPPAGPRLTDEQAIRLDW